MKKLFTPILVLGLIVGFSALTLGATQASSSQTLTVNVSSAYELADIASDAGTVTVGPDTSDSVNSLNLGYKVNDGTGAAIEVDWTSTYPTGLTLTFKNMFIDSNGGSGQGPVTLSSSSSTHSKTLIDLGSGTGFSAGAYSSSGADGDAASFDILASSVDWSESAGSKNLNIVYKITA